MALMGSRKKGHFFFFVRPRDKNISESEEIFEVCSGSKLDNGFFYQRYPAEYLSEPFIVFGENILYSGTKKLATLFSPLLAVSWPLISQSTAPLLKDPWRRYPP